MLVLGVEEVLVLVLRCVSRVRSKSAAHNQCVCVIGGDLPLVREEAGKMDGRPAGMTEVIPTDSGVPPQAHAVKTMLQGLPGEVLVLGHDSRDCGVACAYGVEARHGVAAAAAAAVVVSKLARVAAGAAIVVVVEKEEGTGAEPVGALVPAAGEMKRRKP
jgi:hypothetical protein